MGKRYNNKRFVNTCQKADEVLNNLYKPVETLTKIIVQISLIIGIIFFLLSPSIDKTVFLVPFLINLGIQFKNKNKEPDQKESVLN